MVKTYAQLYMEARKVLTEMDGPQAGLTARELLCAASGKTREQLIAQQELYVTESVEENMAQLVHRYLQGAPLAYLLGEWDFYGMTLYVDENVLIPRDDTCALVDLALRRAGQLPVSPRILDLCTGSGCIGLALAKAIPNARVTLGDNSKDALAVAKKNIKRHGLTGRVTAMEVNALEPAPGFLGKFDLIVSNPPYITDEEMTRLDKSVRDYEPHLALRGGADGLDFYRAIVENFSPALKPGGFLAFEYGMGQGYGVATIMQAADYHQPEIRKDNQGINRAIIACNLREDET